MQGSERHREIVGIAAAARQERRVFLAPNRHAESLCHA
jgi:hypothetical protein